MNTNNLRWRKKTAKFLVRIAGPIIEDYLRVAYRLPLYSNLSDEEFAEQIAPQFAEMILSIAEPLWPDFPDLTLHEVRRHIIKRLMHKDGLKRI